MKHNWEYRRLGDVCSFERGVTYSKDDESEFESDVVILRSNNIDLESSSLNFSDLKYLKSCFQIKESKKLKANTILICMSNGSLAHLGKTAFVSQNLNMAFGGFMGLIIPESQNPKYLSYVLRSPIYYSFLDSLNRGANIRNLQFSKLSKLHIPVPPMETQKQIVAELDQINDLIAKNRELLSQLDALAQSLFYDTFGDPISNPKRWVAKRFKDILCKIGSGATPRGGKQAYQGGEVSLIRSLNVYNTYFKYDELAKINDEQAYELRNVEVFNNDVLLNITGASVARCFIVPVDTLPARVNQHVAILRPNDKYIQSIYLHRLLITPAFQNYLIGTARGKSATREALPKATLEKIEIPVPPLALQEDFAAKVEAVEAQKEKVEAEIAELQTLLDARMDYWFN